MPERLLVTGAGGFIGGHLVANLLREGNEVRAVDIKPLQEWYQLFPEAENLQLDLCGKDACERAVRDVSLIYNLAADMGGMGFIENQGTLHVERAAEHPHADDGKRSGSFAFLLLLLGLCLRSR